MVIEQGKKEIYMFNDNLKKNKLHDVFHDSEPKRCTHQKSQKNAGFITCDF